MYIALYCVVIVVFCALVVTFFVVRDLKHKKNYKKLNENKEMQPSNDVMLGKETEPDFIGGTELKKEVEFEDYNFEDGNETVKRGTTKPLRINPFGFDEGADDESELDDKFEEYEKFLRQSLDLDEDDNQKDKKDEEDDDKKFEEYEEFLRRNLDIDDKQNDTSDIDALANFDFNSLRGKSETEIDEILRTLPPKARELLMTDILAKKNYDEE